SRSRWFCDTQFSECEGFEFREEGLGLRGNDGEGVDGNQAVLADQFGGDTAQSSLVHLAVHLLRMVLRTRREDDAAAAPQRAAAATGTRATATLLFPWFLA